MRLEREEIAVHPGVIGEIAMGFLKQRDWYLRTMADLPRVVPVSDDEVLEFVERHRLFGLGIGWIDAHLLASTQLTPSTLLWTRDKRLRRAAETMGHSAPLD
jgi:predicted nucleic acid-binding protein